MALQRKRTFPCSIWTFVSVLIYLIVTCSALVVYLVYQQVQTNYPPITADKDDGIAKNPEKAEANQTSFEWIRKTILRIPTTVAEPDDGHLNMNRYPYVINEPDKCQSASPFLVLIIATVAGESEKRDAIRQTWGNESLGSGIPIVRIFMLGMDNTLDQKLILQESEMHHDIIQKNFQDTYKNLTIKTMMGIEWVSVFCTGAKYVMKTDSDMFINTEHLLDFLGTDLPVKENYFTGYLLANHQPHRNVQSKWHMPYELYPDSFYPTFCSGTGYVFSGDVALKVLRASFTAKFVYLEDVFVGICLDKEKIQITHPAPSLFNNHKVEFAPCAYNRLITSHEISPSEIVVYWKLMQEHKKICNGHR